MTPQQRKLVTVQSTIWACIVLLGMTMSFMAALSFTGMISWYTPSMALFGVLGTFAFVATQFSLTLGGGERKYKKDKDSNANGE